MLRKILFWSHLACGLAAGVLIGIMSFTGAALTFEKDLIAWAERDARRIDPPARGTGLPTRDSPPAAHAPRLSLDAILQRARTAQPGLRVANLSVSADPHEAVALGAPGNKTYCVNPYTGEVREATAPRMRAFMQTMRNWHLRLNFKPTPGQPTLGTRLNAAANLVFVFLGVSGLVLWWPRAWTLRGLRPSLWLNPEARGKARDWNWHNAIGFWSLPLLLILAGTGVVLSYRWAGNLVYTLAGEKPPAPAAPPATNTAPRPAPPPAPATPPPTVAVLAPDALLAAAQKPHPDWSLVTLRFNPPLAALPAGQAAPKTFSAVVKTKNQWPPFFSKTLTLDAVTGEVRRTDTFAALSTGTRARRWIRLLHSAEALGPFVALLSGLACLGGCVLVYTGFALSWRRFFARRAP